MQEQKQNISIFQIIVAVMDAVMVIYVGLYYYWAFIAGTAGTGFLSELFDIINPLTTGAYLYGAVVLLHFSVFRNLPGRCLIAVPYLFTVISSGLMIMSVANSSDWLTLILLFMPHIIIIDLAFIIIWMQQRKKREDRNQKGDASENTTPDV